MTSPDPQRDSQSVRTVLQGLILLGIVTIVGVVSDGRVQNAKIIEQITAIQRDISSVPALRDDVITIKAKQAELTRRQDADDALHERLGVLGPDRWKR
ncbi:MAG: hypothetical protein ABI114_11095 [Rhodanobacter sp.]